MVNCSIYQGYDGYWIKLERRKVTNIDNNTVVFPYILKYIAFSHFYFFTILSKYNHKKGNWPCLQRTQNNWPYQYTNITFVVPLRSSLSPQCFITNYCSTTIFAHHQTSPVSNLTTTNKVDTDINIDNNIQTFSAPRKHNHSTPEIPDSTTTTTLVRPNVHYCLIQKSSST